MAIKLSDAFVKQFGEVCKEYNKQMLEYVNSYEYKRELVKQRRLERLEEEENNGNSK